jgi:hypothetical protein
MGAIHHPQKNWALPPHKDMDYHIQSNFWKLYLIRTDFTISERVSLVKVFRLFKLEWIVFGVQSVDTVGRCTTSSYLLAGPACVCDALIWMVEDLHA